MGVDREYYAVGETFEYEGKMLKTLISDTCVGCYFDCSPYCNQVPLCNEYERKDYDSVFFVEVQKEESSTKLKTEKPKTKVKYSDKNTTISAVVDASGNIEVNAVSGYNTNVDTICTVEDNGNGYYVNFKSYSSINPDHIMNLDYCELEYLWLAYKAIRKDRKKKNETAV